MLRETLAEIGLRPKAGSKPPGYAQLHQAILTGFVGSVGRMREKREYDGTRGMRFVIAPGTKLAAHPPKWVVAASLVETTRVYARMVASVQPGWIEAAAAHLVKRTYSEAHWLESRGYVAAYESVSLHGLLLTARRRVNYSAIAPREAHEIFLREALVEGRARFGGGFLEANRRLREEIELLEAKIRRRDILVDAEALVDFYRARVPEHVSTVAGFERWRVEAERANPGLLYMSRSDLMRRDVPEVNEETFPDTLTVGANRLPLLYRFEPAAPDDGVTLIVPEPLVEALDAEQLAWLVPGYRLEKLIALLRSLPKSLRKQLVPVPEHAAQALQELNRLSTLPPFHEWAAQWISRRAGEPVTPAQLAALPLPDHLRMNVRVVGERDEVIAEGRDVAAIVRSLRMAARRAEPTATALVHRSWDFGDLPETEQVQRNRLRLVVYPAIEDRGSGVARIEARSAAHAEALIRPAVARLAILALPQQAAMIRKRIAGDHELVLLSRNLSLAQALPDALTERAFRECFAPDDAPLPRSREAFQALLDARRSEVSDVADRLTELLRQVLRRLHAVRMELSRLRSPAFASAVADVESQLAALLPPDFLQTTPYAWLQQMPRYLEAVARRIARLQDNVRRDAELAARVRPFEAALRELIHRARAVIPHPEIDRLRWMIEEFRVSLYAQDLRTLLRVSEKRLSEQMERARAEALA